MDMFEPGSRLTPYGEMYNLVIEPTFVEKKNLADFAQALHRVKFKISAFLARQTLAVKADFSELFDNETVYPGLPRIAYAYQVYSKQYNTNNYDEPMFYGYSIADTLPLVVQPTEIIDGALSSVGGARLMETYSIQNHCVILDLLRRHGKDINFVGTVITVVSLDGKRRHLASTMLGNLMKEVFHADGVILTKNLGGAGNVCMAEAASKCEDRGIKTTMILQILNAESNLSSEILFDDKRLNAIVQNGVYFDRVCLPAVDVVYGGPKDTKIFSDRFEQKATDALELQAYCVFGRICQTGSNYEHAEEY